LKLRIDLAWSAAHAVVAGQLRAMNSFQEKISTALCVSPLIGQAASGSVAWAGVILVGQAEAAQPVPPKQACRGVGTG